MSGTAVVLFNLGGPDSLAAVEPFLTNLFSDPAIVRLPNPLRRFVARRIVRGRAEVARGIFARLGNASPLLANTERQARALEQALGPEFKCFIAMRYWGPSSAEAARAAREWGARRTILLPLYPQFSSTTTASSFAAWRTAARRAGLKAPAHLVCCYPHESGFVAALAGGIERAIAAWPAGMRLRILLSAHGLPRRIVARGDPYRWQVEATAAALRRRVAREELDWVVCYQSRVGRLAWLEPATDAEIRRAGADGAGVIVVPIAFVSEHSETLVELDMEYGRLADESGVPRYIRVATVEDDPAFIAGLAGLVRRALASGAAHVAGEGEGRFCPAGLKLCAFGGARP